MDRLAPESRLLPPGLIDAHAYAMQTRGYHVIPGFLDAAHCADLRARLAAAIDAYRPRPGVERSSLDQYLLHDLLCRDIEYARLLDDSRLQPLVAPLLGEHWVMYAFTSSSLPPGASNYGRRIHVDSPRFVHGYSFNVGLIWALDDFTAENGATEILPGSHHNPREPQEDFFDAHHERVECAAGSLIVFDARAFHRSGMNRSGRWRHALTMNACRPFMKQRMDWVRFVPAAIAAQLGAQARRLIGYDTRVPTSLDEFFLPEAERLYKPGQG